MVYATQEQRNMMSCTFEVLVLNLEGKLHRANTFEYETDIKYTREDDMTEIDSIIP